VNPQKIKKITFFANYVLLSDLLIFDVFLFFAVACMGMKTRLVMSSHFLI